jgi:wyosine [tRNA(Phe)-imidazoG37] synthetase (radical SAM superfamily)
MNKYIFGPVPSRRLGRSLGVDLVPLKTCSYDCIYCQLGHTTCKTTERKEWVPLDDVILEVKDGLSARPDYITLSGSGEPTLHSRIGEAIERIKAMTDVPVAVLTNGSLLWQEEVRRQLLKADLVIPSLDAGEKAVFRLVNRPHADVSFERMLAGLVVFRREFRGDYWLEVFVLGAYTAINADFAELVKCVNFIGPDRVQLNTVTRPPAESFAIGISRQRLAELAGMFHPPAEVIADFRGVQGRAEFAASREDILDLLRRRPCSTEDIADGLGMHGNEVVKHVEHLSAEGRLRETRTGGRLYYRAL